jgi:hypothetical protein
MLILESLVMHIIDNTFYIYVHNVNYVFFNNQWFGNADL